MTEQEKHGERIKKIKPFINKYKLEGINFPLKKVALKEFEKNNVTIALNVLYAKNEKIYLAFLSKNNSYCEKQAILLMISNGEKQHYLELKKIISIIKK